MYKKRKKDWKHRATVGMVAAAASAGVLVGSAFDSPEDLLGADSDETPVVQGEATPSAADLPDGGDGDAERRQRGGAARRWIASWPAAARALIGVPLWFVGWGAAELLGLVWQAVLTPLGGQLLSWLLTAAAAVAVYALTAKAFFPDTPWKKLLRRRTLLLVAGSVLLLGAADTILRIFWSDYPPVGRLLRLLGGLLAVVAGHLWLRRHSHRRAADAKSVPDSRTDVERRAKALADSVCPPADRPL